MLFVQLSSIVLVGYFVTAHCILTPILFKYHYTIHRRAYVLYKRKKQTQFVPSNHVCLFDYSISLFLIFSKNISIRFTASLIFCKELE